jgi:hypothetical protein
MMRRYGRPEKLMFGGEFIGILLWRDLDAFRTCRDVPGMQTSS